MDQEEQINSTHLQTNDISRLIQLTYRGRTTQEIRDAESQLHVHFTHPLFFQTISNFLGSSQFDDLFKKSAANLLKRYSYELSRKAQADKSKVISELYALILEEGLPVQIKELLGCGLEYQLNSDEENLYKSVIFNKISQAYQAESKDTLSIFGGLTIISLAYFNSLVETDDQVHFILQILDSFSEKTSLIVESISQLQVQLIPKEILSLLKLALDFLEIIFERVADEEDIFADQIKEIRSNQKLLGLLEKSLLLFNNEFSIVSSSHPQTNACKSTAMNMIKHLFIQKEAPERLFRIIFITFLSECKTFEFTDEPEHILIRCIQILETHLDKRIYYSIFLEHKLDTLFALFMYSITRQEELSHLHDEPERFIEMAEEYSEAIHNTLFIKSRAACLLKVFATRIDETVRNILEICIVVLSGCLDPSESDTETMQAIKKQFSKFDFFGLTSETKVETAFMIMTVISPIIFKREDLSRIVYAFFVTQKYSLLKIENELIILRLIRTLGYYPTSIYYEFVQNQMQRGRVFILEGLNAFQRILRSTRHPELFQVLSKIFLNILDVVAINDHLFEILILNNFEPMLQKSLILYQKCLLKIKSEFERCLNQNEHNTLLCFNYLFALLKKQKKQAILQEITAVFYSFEQHIETFQSESLFSKYEDKLIDFYELLLEKQYTINLENEAFQLNQDQISSKIEDFGWRMTKRLPHHFKGSNIFKFYNSFFLKLNLTKHSSETFLKGFVGEILARFKSYMQKTSIESDSAQYQLQVIAYYGFLISQLLVTDPHLKFAEEDLVSLMSISTQISQEISQHVLAIILTYMYTQPKELLRVLSQTNSYSQMMSHINKHYTCQTKLMMKIYIFGLVKLLEVEEDELHIQHLLMQCMNVLKKQKNSNCIKLIKNNLIELKNRRDFEHKSYLQEESMVQESHNELVQIFVKFKHPFDSLNQYDQFKVRLWQNEHLLAKLPQDSITLAKELMETDWAHGKTRRVLKVKRQENDDFK